MSKKKKKQVKPIGFFKKYETLLFFVVVSVLIVGLSILLTWPLAKNFSSAIIGQANFTDGPFFIWNLWWVKKAISMLSNPFVSQYVYYPSRTNLALHTPTYTSGLIYLPLSLFFRPLTSLNIIQFLSFLSSAIGMIVLVQYLTKPQTLIEKSSAIISALIFAFSPFVFSHLMAGHYNLSMIWPIPFVVYFLYRSIEEGRLQDAIWLGIASSTLAYVDLQLTFFTIIICLPIIIGMMISRKREFFSRKTLVNLGISLLLFVVIFLAPYGYMMREFWGLKELLSTYNNGDVKVMFGLNPLNPLFKGANLKMLLNLIGSYRENEIPLGFMALLLSLMGIILFSKTFLRDKIIFIIIFFLGVILAMGPHFQYNSIIYQNIKLPYFYLQNLPFFNLGLVPSRFVLIAYFAIAVLSGLFLFSAVKFFEDRKLIIPAMTIIIVCSIFVLGEYYCGQMLMDPLFDVKEVQQISKESGDFTILPYCASQRDAYLQTLHDKKVVTGFLGRRIHDYYLSKYNDVYPINKFAKGKADELNLGDNPREIMAVFEQYKIKYIIIDKYFKNSGDLERLDKYLSLIGVSKTFDSDQVMIYKVY